MLKMIVTGRITEPKEEVTPGGKKFLQFSVADEYREKVGEDVFLRTRFIEIDLWNFKNAVKKNDKEVATELLEKGLGVRVTGSPVFDSWNDKESNELKKKIKINAQVIELIDIE